MTDETTTEQLAEIEGQATEFTPVPDGWRLLASGETLQEGDQWIRPWDGRWISVCVGSHAAVSGGQYIRQIASEPDWQAEEIQYLQREMSTLQKQLEAVKAELVTQAETSRRLQIELDAAQQVPADSPELRQLRADLADVTLDRDQYRHAHELLLNDANTAHQRTKAMTVEAIAEWLVPVQAAIAAADNVAESTRAGWLAEEVIQHLPQIMRHLTGLESPEDVD